MHQNICCLFQTHANDFSGQPKYRHTPKHTHGHIFNLLHVPWCGKLWFFTKGLEARNIFSNFPFFKAFDLKDQKNTLQTEFTLSYHQPPATEVVVITNPDLTMRNCKLCKPLGSKLSQTQRTWMRCRQRRREPHLLCIHLPRTRSPWDNFFLLFRDHFLVSTDCFDLA